MTSILTRGAVEKHGTENLDTQKTAKYRRQAEQSDH